MDDGACALCAVDVRGRSISHRAIQSARADAPTSIRPHVADQLSNRRTHTRTDLVVATTGGAPAVTAGAVDGGERTRAARSKPARGAGGVQRQRSRVGAGPRRRRLSHWGVDGVRHRAVEQEGRAGRCVRGLMEDGMECTAPRHQQRGLLLLHVVAYARLAYLGCCWRARRRVRSFEGRRRARQ